MNEIEELKKDLDVILTKATEYDKLDHKFKQVCGKGVEQTLQHLCVVGLGDGSKVNHEPVEVPEFIKNVMQKYNSLQDMLTEEYYSNYTSEMDSDAVSCWIDTNFDLLCRAWLDGYTVAKEPLYYVYDKTTKQYLGYDRVTKQAWWLIKHNEGARAAMTESQIKDLDESYWSSAVPVEEETE